MDMKQFRDYIVVPTLDKIGLLSPSAVKLLLITAAHESEGLTYIEQLGKANARGFFQMETDTLDDLIKNLGFNRPDLIDKLYGFKPPQNSMHDALYTCLAFQVVACRLQYWRFPEPLADYNDDEGMWRYYKKYWNTHLGDAARHEVFEDMMQYLPGDMDDWASSL